MNKTRSGSLGLGRFWLCLIVLGGLATSLGAAAPLQAFQGEDSSEQAGLQAFDSDAELAAFFREMQEAEVRRIRALQRQAREAAEARAAAGLPPLPPPPPPPPPPPSPAPSALNAASSFADADGITNNQTAGVDEGGIVKARGNMLVILRRGRLFTVSIADGEQRAIDSINAFPPDASGSGSWYDEMLIAEDWIIVIGYSYARGGTEINRFRLGDDGQLTYVDAHHLRSADYYSADNYASRLIGNELVFYTPLNLHRGSDPFAGLPGLKRWQGDPADREFQRIAGPQQIYASESVRRGRIQGASTLHSVTTCDATAPVFTCSAMGVVGGQSREFYVSGSAVYLWVADVRETGPDATPRYSHIYRLPLDSAAPSAIGARGAPLDQFSFREDRDENRLNVLVQAGYNNHEMWLPDAPIGMISLMQIPLDEFGNGSNEVRQRYYRHLGRTQTERYRYDIENRFVGSHLVYGYGRAASGDARAFALPLNGGATANFSLDHRVERIEILGSDAVVIGSGPENSLGFTAINLGDGLAKIGNVFMMPASSQGSSRSHAYFYRPDPGSANGVSGTLGLPILRFQIPAELRSMLGNSAAMLFLRRDNRTFSAAGELGAEVEGVVDDNCQASCVDWYGNARPIFLRDRIFALLGYELVEGRMENGRISEIDRLSYAPRPAGPPAN